MKHGTDIEELKRLYVEQGLTSRQIGELTGIPFRTVLRYLQRAGVPRRCQGYPIIDQLADRGWLMKRYWGDRRSTTEIAAEVGCGSRSVALWLKRHGIPARGTGAEKGHKRNDSEECRQKMSLSAIGKRIGPANPNWRGGIQTRHPERGRYRAKMWAKAVKDRDGWACTKCGSTDNLHAHHKKRWRDYPDLRYDLDNGITLCHPCHERAHGSKVKFRAFKQAKISTSAPAPS